MSSKFATLFIFLSAILLIPLSADFRDYSVSLNAAHKKGELLVKLKKNDKIYKINTQAGQLKSYIQAAQKNSSIEYIEPNYYYTMSIEPDDEFYTQQIYLSSIQANLGWNYSTGNNSVIIAVLDTGVDYNHPDLKNNIWHNLKEIPDNNIDDDKNGYVDDYHGWDFVSNDARPLPKIEDEYTFLAVNHGTIVSGIAAAEGNNNQGVSGVAWRAKIMPLRVLNSQGSGNTLDVAKAIDYAVKNGADVINLSFVGDGRSTTLENSIAKASKAGVLVIAAAGNEVNEGVDMNKNPKYPVCHDGGYGNNWVIGVASVDKQDKLASFSNYGDCIDLVAPGVGIFSTLYKNDELPRFTRYYGGYWSGTSVSAPQVSGLVALIKSLKPHLSLLEIKSLLLKNTTNITQKNKLYSDKLGQGKVNVHKVLSATLNTLSDKELSTDLIITGTGTGGGAHIRFFEENKLKSQFFGFDNSLRFGVNVSSFDLDGNGVEEVVAAANQGEEPRVKIFDSEGQLKREFLAFPKEMKNGIFVEVGDLNNDGSKEVVAVAQKDYVPLVKVFNLDGTLKKQFYAFNEFFKGGLTLEVADINQDNFDDIIVATGQGAMTTIKIFNHQYHQIGQFIPFGANYTSGVNLAAGDVDNDSAKEIIVGAKNYQPQVKIFDWQGRLKKQFLAYHPNFKGGVNLAVGDINGDGNQEVITGAGSGGGPHVRVFTGQGDLVTQFFAYNQSFTGGVYVASGK